MARLLRSCIQDFVQEVPMAQGTPFRRPQRPPLLKSRWQEGEGGGFTRVLVIV